MQLALAADFSFGGRVHDGFRLPETQSVLPPYLRAHEGTVDYRVTGAAVPAEGAKTDSGGVAVYLRPLTPGDDWLITLDADDAELIEPDIDSQT